MDAGSSTRIYASSYNFSKIDYELGVRTILNESRKTVLYILSTQSHYRLIEMILDSLN
jgi:hypothetical protein